MGEVRGWLEQCGFTIVRLFGDWQGQPYTQNGGRAIFWAVNQVQSTPNQQSIRTYKYIHRYGERRYVP
jgi:hypothetical protein